jgi:hypothetical protein
MPASACGPAASPRSASDVEGEERVVVAAEIAATVTGDQLAEAARRVRAVLVAEHEAPVHEVVLLAAGTVPKTSSGKIRRGATRQLYIDGGLDAVAAAGPATAPVPDDAPAPSAEPVGTVGEFLADRIAEATGTPRGLVAERRMDEIGLDSLGSVQLLHDIERRFGVRLSLGDLRAGSVGDVAALVARRPPPESVGEPAAADAFPVPPTVRGLWFLERLAPGSGAYHLARAFTVSGALDADALDAALRLLLERHPALRTVYPERAGEPVAVTLDVPDRLLRVTHVGDDLDDRLADFAGAPFDVARGPLVRADLLVPDAGPAVLVMAAHHLAVDLWSAAVVVEELRRSYPPWPPADRSGCRRRPTTGSSCSGSPPRRAAKRAPTGTGPWTASCRCWSCHPRGRAHRRRPSPERRCAGTCRPAWPTGWPGSRQTRASPPTSCS